MPNYFFKSKGKRFVCHYDTYSLKTAHRLVLFLQNRHKYNDPSKYIFFLSKERKKEEKPAKNLQ